MMLTLASPDHKHQERKGGSSLAYTLELGLHWFFLICQLPSSLASLWYRIVPKKLLWRQGRQQGNFIVFSTVNATSTGRGWESAYCKRTKRHSVREYHTMRVEYNGHTTSVNECLPEYWNHKHTVFVLCISTAYALSGSGLYFMTREYPITVPNLVNDFVSWFQIAFCLFVVLIVFLLHTFVNVW